MGGGVLKNSSHHHPPLHYKLQNIPLPLCLLYLPSPTTKNMLPQAPKDKKKCDKKT